MDRSIPIWKFSHNICTWDFHSKIYFFANVICLHKYFHFSHRRQHSFRRIIQVKNTFRFSTFFETEREKKQYSTISQSHNQRLSKTVKEMENFARSHSPKMFEFSFHFHFLRLKHTFFDSQPFSRLLHSLKSSLLF